MIEEAGEESKDKIEMAKSFLALDSMTDEMWEKFVKDIFVCPGERLDIRWNFDV